MFYTLFKKSTINRQDMFTPPTSMCLKQFFLKVTLQHEATVSIKPATFSVFICSQLTETEQMYSSKYCTIFDSLFPITHGFVKACIENTMHEVLNKSHYKKVWSKLTRTSAKAITLSTCIEFVVMHLISVLSSITNCL